MDVAALGGSISILETLHKAGRDATGIINTAAHSGHLGAVIWAYEHGDPTGGYTAIANAALGGHLDIAQWLHKHDYYVTSRACDAAAENGHLHIMEWFHANGLDGFTSDAMDDAAAGGHLDVVKWLHANSSAGCTKNAKRFAIRRGHDDVVVFLAQHRPEVALLVTDALLAVVKANSPSRVKQLYTTKPESYTQAAFREACREGHVRIVRFFLKHEHGFDADMLQAAAAKDPSVAGIMMDSMSLDAARAMLEDVAGKGKEYAATKRRLETLVKRLLVAQIRVGMSKHKRATN
ncbi:hypothetical protein BC831DRAFT_455225 [Entophlyctis helioformis]|nr:hypothetical protein BC831DRAFT_455225 [Entophlyctis helioformis]